MKSRVVLLKCNEYDKEKIYEELSWGIGQIGGVGQLVRSEERILLKPNLLRKAEADSAIVTHPLVVSAVGRILKEADFPMETRRGLGRWKRLHRPAVWPER